MFPSAPHRRLATALLELADAMLRPVDGAPEAPAHGRARADRVDDGIEWPWPPTCAARRVPAGRPAASRRPRRRRGAPPPSAHPCVTPLVRDVRARRAPGRERDR